VEPAEIQHLFLFLFLFLFLQEYLDKLLPKLRECDTTPEPLFYRSQRDAWRADALATIPKQKSVAFKLVNNNLCGFADFQYRVGGEYRMDGPIQMCARGFHYCLALEHCYLYVEHLARPYRCLLVEVTGRVISDADGRKHVTDRLRVIKEIPAPRGDACGFP
jgi:hypothetical protein